MKTKLLLLPLLLLLPTLLLAGPELDPLRRIAIQEGGRVKPLDTFARETSRRITGARAFGAESVQGLDPVEWLLAMLIDPKKWSDEPIIRVTHAGLRDAAKLPAGKDRFSYNELSNHPGFKEAADKVHAKFKEDPEAKLDPIEREISALFDTLGTMNAIFSGDAWRIIPHPTDARATWYSLADLQSLEAADSGRIRLLMYAVATQYRDLAALERKAKDNPSADKGELETARREFKEASIAISGRLADRAPSVYPAAIDLDREVHYNQVKPFRTAWLFYLLGFLLLLTSFYATPRWLAQGGFAFLIAGFAVHAYGMALRILISGRPPVTNMYESVIWVAWGAMLFALVFELIYKARYFATCAGGVAVIALVLADNVPILNGAIEPLVPVLRDNMWLTIHVLTITLSYAAYFLAMAIAHVTLGLYFFAPGRQALLKTLSNFLYRALQLGTILGIIGTALGGWWASYSWGRFWGWDAKETSIFVAILFYLAMIHGRMVGWLRDFGTAIVGVLGFLGVLWAWYGVNFVLGVGLHSYGFGSGGYWYVGSFVAMELLIVAAATIRYRSHKPPRQGAPPATELQPANN
jgi:ABC-type transport system involved in cytochrome c biogenesis permease subunit